MNYIKINFDILNKIIIILQIFIALFYIQYSNWIGLYVDILLLEYVFFDQNARLLKYYNIYILSKVLAIAILTWYQDIYEMLFVLATYQFLLYYFNKDRLSMYKYKINLYYAIIGIGILLYYFLESYQFKLFDLLLAYLVVTLILLYIKSIHLDNKFCTIKEYSMDNLAYVLQGIPLSFLFLVFIVLVEFLFIIDINLYMILLIMVLIILSVFFEKNQYNVAKYKYNFTFIKYYKLPIIFIVGFFILLWLIDFDIRDKDYSDYSAGIFSTIANIAILNIASLLVLMQLNYQRYGSSYLLIKLFKSPILLFITFFPSITLILNIYFFTGNVTPEVEMLPTLFLVLSFLSTSLLFIYTNTLLETNLIIRALFKDIKHDDFSNYKKNIINLKETNIDTISKILTRIIENNDSETSHALFYNLGCWIKLNISNIDNGNGFYREDINNKFNDFFRILINNLASSNNNIIHQNFIDAMNSMVMKEINAENYQSYKMVYNFMFEYLFLMLKKYNEEIAKDIYKAIYQNSSKILLHLPNSKLENDFVRFDKHLSDFKNIFIENFREIIDVSIENKDIEFLKDINFYKELFLEGWDEGREKWDGKIFDIFVETRHTESKKNKYLIDNNTYNFYIYNNYELFMPYINMSDKNKKYIYDNEIMKYVITELVNLFQYAIEQNKITDEHDLEIIWEQIYGSIRNDDFHNFKVYISLYTFIVDKACKSYIEDKTKSYIIESLWARLTYISKDQYIISRIYIDFSTYLKEKIYILENKYPKLKEFDESGRKYKMISKMNILDEFSI